MVVTLVVAVVLVVIFLKKDKLLQLLHIQYKLVVVEQLQLKVVLQSLIQKPL
jgi:hypothetical protein